jgi:VanZ family protein
LNNTARQDAPSSSLPAFVWWATTIAWTITIYQLSTGTFGPSLTGWALDEILTLLGIKLSAPTFAAVHHLVRKLAHVTEYGIYALLLYGSLGGGKEFAWHGRRAAWCAGIAGTYSLTDELHQWFEPGRGGSLLDSALDTTGAVVAMAGLYAVTRLLQTRRRRSAAREANPAET